MLAFLPWKSPASSRRFDQPVRSVPCGWHCLSCGRPSAGQPDGRRCLAVLALWRLQGGVAFLSPPRVTRFGRQAATHASCESCCSLSSMRSSPSQCSSLASYNFASIDGYALATSHRDEGPTTPTSRSIRPNTPARLGVPSHLLQRSKRSDARFGQRYDERTGTQLRSLLPLSARNAMTRPSQRGRQQRPGLPPPPPPASAPDQPSSDRAKGGPLSFTSRVCPLQFFKNDAKFLVPQHGVSHPFFSSASTD